MQCCNTHGTIRDTSRKRLKSLPTPGVPHPDVSNWNTPGGFSACIDTVKRFLPADALWNLALAINGSYFPSPLCPQSKPIGSSDILSRDSRTLSETTLLNWRKTTVYLTLFRKYNAQQLKALEWKHHLMVRLIPVDMSQGSIYRLGHC